ncbi:hypothetical protein A2U01_0035877 [Trifolium medium]|uniref:Uncharacterized protein n=1 Tax=Trifolium medium TaxID=97028 RepID=A0A392PUZ6_9FABA|nr:hypothetical protein [Trifolium medium]
MTKERLKNKIHGGLKCGGGIAQAERHYQKFVVALMSAESCLMNIPLSHSNLVVSSTKIQFGKPTRAIQFIQKFVDSRNWKAIFASYCIQSSIINTKSPSAVFFAHQQNRRRKCTGTVLNEAIC